MEGRKEGKEGLEGGVGTKEGTWEGERERGRIGMLRKGRKANNIS